MISQDLIITILTVLVPAIVTVSGIIIAWQTEKLRTMREQLSEKKYNAYADAVTMFYSVIKGSKTNVPLDNKVALMKMIDIKRDIFMYGSDRVFKAFNKWLLYSSSQDNTAQFAAFLDFVLEMRRDMCNNKTKLSKRDILLNLTQSEEEASKIFD